MNICQHSEIKLLSRTDFPFHDSHTHTHMYNCILLYTIHIYNIILRIYIHTYKNDNSSHAHMKPIFNSIFNSKVFDRTQYIKSISLTKSLPPRKHIFTIFQKCFFDTTYIVKYVADSISLTMRCQCYPHIGMVSRTKFLQSDSNSFVE